MSCLLRREGSGDPNPSPLRPDRFRQIHSPRPPVIFLQIAAPDLITAAVYRFLKLCASNKQIPSQSGNLFDPLLRRAVTSDQIGRPTCGNARWYMNRGKHERDDSKVL